MNEKERIELLMKCYELTPSQFADKVGIQRASISHIISGRNKPSLDVMLKIYEAFPDLDMKWLMTGEGEIPSAAPQQPSALDNTLFSAMAQTVVPQSNSQPIAVAPANQSDSYRQPEAPRVQQKLPVERQPRKTAPSRVPAQQPAPVRRIKEVRIFDTDGTYETLVPEK